MSMSISIRQSVKSAIRSNLDEKAYGLMIRHDAILSRSDIRSIIRYMVSDHKFPYKLIRHIYYDSRWRYVFMAADSVRCIERDRHYGRRTVFLSIYREVLMHYDDRYADTFRLLYSGAILSGIDITANTNMRIIITDIVYQMLYHGLNGLFKLMAFEFPTAVKNLMFRATMHDRGSFVRILLDEGLSDTDDKNRAFGYACQNGFYDIAEMLLIDGCVDSAYDENRPIRSAAYHNKPNIIKLLLTDRRVDPSARSNVAICSALSIFTGSYETVEVLMSDDRVDPSGAIFEACRHGYTRTLELLLASPRADASINNNQSIKQALTIQNTEAVRILIDRPEVKAHIDDLRAYVVRYMDTDSDYDIWANQLVSSVRS